MPRQSASFWPSWVGLAVFVLGCCLLLFPLLPAVDMTGEPLRVSVSPWLTLGCMGSGVLLLAVGRRRGGNGSHRAEPR